MKVAAASAGAVLAKGLLPPHSFQLVNVAYADAGAGAGFTFAYISDTHLYEKKLNERFVRSALKAVEDVNALIAAAGLRALRRRSGAARQARGARRSARRSSRR